MGDPNAERQPVPGAPTRRTVLAATATAVVGAGGLAGLGTAQVTTRGVITVPQDWQEEDLSGFLVRAPEDPGGSDGDGGSGEDGTTGEDGADSGGAGETDDGGESGGTDGGTDDGDGTDNGDDVETAGDNSVMTDVAADEIPECDFGDWPPGTVDRYTVRLVDRKEGESETRNARLYVGSDVDLRRPAEYLVNTFERCDGEHAGVELELVEEGTVGENGEGGAGPAVQVEDEERPTTGAGPGGETADGGPGGGETADGGPGLGVLGALAGLAGLSGLLARRRDE